MLLVGANFELVIYLLVSKCHFLHYNGPDVMPFIYTLMCVKRKKNLYRYKVVIRGLHEITQSPALGTVRLINRKMLYVKCVGLCLSTWGKLKINIPHHSDSHCHCMGSMIPSTSDM